MIENLTFADNISEIITAGVKNDSMKGLVWNLIQSMPSNISIWEDGKVLYANPAFYRSVDIKNGDIEALNILVESDGYFQVHPDDFDYSPENTKAVKEEIKSGVVFRKEMRMKSRVDTEYRWYNTYIVKGNDPNSKIVIEIDEDIHEKKLSSEKLIEAVKEKEALVNEKELLIKEIHHRVKNNFQVISSLLKLQAGKVEEDSVKIILEESRSRIMSMSKIHEMLYKTENLEHINFRENISDIIISLVDLYGGNSRFVKFDIECNDIQLDIDKAIPCSLILNELISNSLKYAFTEWDKAVIKIRLEEEGGFLRLSLSDNGIGYPGDNETRNPGSIGLMIVRTFTAQLKGDAVFRNNGGAECIITFPE